jgi:hypothetical protein
VWREMFAVIKIITRKRRKQRRLDERKKLVA